MNTFRSYFPHFFTLFLAKLASSRHFLVKSAIFSLFIVKSAFFAHSCVKPAFFAHFWSALVVRFVHISKTVKKYVRGKFSTYLCPWGKPQGLKIVLPVLVLESPQSEESGAFHVCLDSLGMYQRFFGSMQGRLALHFLQCHFLHWNPDFFFDWIFLFWLSSVDALCLSLVFRVVTVGQPEVVWGGLWSSRIKDITIYCNRNPRGMDDFLNWKQYLLTSQSIL